MSNEKHILFDMDSILSNSLDEMINNLANTANTPFKRIRRDDLDGKPYQRSLQLIQDRISQMADPDVAEIAPVLIDIFDSKKKWIEESDKNRDTKDEILYALSVQRKRMGLDSRKYKRSDDPSTQRIEIAH